MGHSKKAKPAPDPDPTPTQADTREQEITAERTERKRVKGQYSREKTILAGNTGENSAKKTILGG